MLERLGYEGELPDSFFSLPAAIYAGLPFAPEEDPEQVRQLLAQEAGGHDIILYTDHRRLRLLGLFPRQGGPASFGFWETADDLALNREAFALLAADAARRGHSTLRGPLHFSTYQRYRLRLGPAPSWQQFDREPVNPAYYPTLLEGLCFQPGLRFESRLLRAEAVPRVYERKSAALARLAAAPFDYIPLTPENWALFADDIRQLIHEIFSQNPAYQPVPRTQFELLYNPAYAARLCPYSSVLFREKTSGRLVALSLCQPNYHGLALPAGGGPDFDRDYPKLKHKTLLAKTVGVHPDFRRQGLQDLLAAHAMRRFQDYYEDIIFCLMRSDNHSLRFAAGLPVETAHYALFELSAT